VILWGPFEQIACENSWLFSDEMYRHLEQANGERATLPSAAESYSRAVTLSGLSKAYGLAGLRLGWLASQDAAVIERCCNVTSNQKSTIALSFLRWIACDYRRVEGLHVDMCWYA
jgi:aspartate/methionine/tyrosine aminotransferase